jgi:hypothetical protein
VDDTCVYEQKVDVVHAGMCISTQRVMVVLLYVCQHADDDGDACIYQQMEDIHDACICLSAYRRY